MKKNYFEFDLEKKDYEDTNEELLYIITICNLISKKSPRNEDEKNQIAVVLKILRKRIVELQRQQRNKSKDILYERSLGDEPLSGRNLGDEPLSGRNLGDEPLSGESLGDEPLCDAFDFVKYVSGEGYVGADVDLLSGFVYIPGFGHFELIMKTEVFSKDGKLSKR